MAVSYELWWCALCSAESQLYLDGRSHQAWPNQSRGIAWLRGWTYIRRPGMWLCPECALTPGRSAALVVLGGDVGPASPPRWDYVFWHALSRVLQLLGVVP